MKAFKGSLAKFMDKPKIKNVNKSFFELFVLVPEDGNVTI